MYVGMLLRTTFRTRSSGSLDDLDKIFWMVRDFLGLLAFIMIVPSEEALALNVSRAAVRQWADCKIISGVLSVQEGLSVMFEFCGLTCLSWFTEPVAGFENMLSSSEDYEDGRLISIGEADLLWEVVNEMTCGDKFKSACFCFLEALVWGNGGRLISNFGGDSDFKSAPERNPSFFGLDLSFDMSTTWTICHVHTRATWRDRWRRDIDFRPWEHGETVWVCSGGSHCGHACSTYRGDRGLSHINDGLRWWHFQRRHLYI